MPKEDLKRAFPESWRWIQFSHRIQGWLTDAEADQLFKLAKHCTPNQRPVGVELGSWKGKSSVMIAAGLKDKYCPRLYCIDPFGCDENPDYQKSYYDPLMRDHRLTVEEAFRRNIKRAGADTIVVPLRGYSFELYAKWAEPFDLLFIDANHEYEAVLRDFLTWSRFLKPEGIIAFHDVSPQWPGPSRVVAEKIKLPEYSRVQKIGGLAWALRYETDACSVDTGGVSVNRVAYDKVFFDQQAQGSISSARVVLPILFEYYKPTSIIDVGCGRGTWLRAASECGVEQLLGLDGDYVERDKLFIDPQEFQVWNLVERIEMPRRFDLAISVEVAEHLPYNRAENFINDLVKLSDLILFSAALPYQGGTDHVNEQWLEFWAIIFRRHGYVPCDLFRSRIWGDKRVEFWYSQNLVLFCKQDLARKLFPPEIVALNRPLSFPHPLTFLVNVTRYRPLSASALDFEFEDYRALLAAYLSGETTPPRLKMVGATQNIDGTKVKLFPDARTQVVSVQEQLSARDGTIQRQSAELTDRETEIRKLSAENRGLRGEMAVLDEKLAHLSKALADRERQDSSLSQALADRERQDSSLSQALAERERQVSNLSQALAERDGTISALLQSRSWKITRPLRSIARSFRTLPKVSSRVRLARAFWAITRSGLFDSKSYLERNPDVASFRWGALWHYLTFGAAEGRDPHPLFSTSFYLQNNRDVAEAGVNPLFHYLRRGAAEGRDPHPLFDSSYYLEHYPDVAKARVNPLLHYVRYGAYEGRDPHPQFDTSYYLKTNPDVAEECLNPLEHYVGPGIAEGRDPNPFFDTSGYLDRNPDVALQGLNPLVHHIAHSAQVSTPASPTPPLAQKNSGGFDLRAALRNEFKESGRVLLDSEYDSYPLVSVVIPCFNQGHFLEDAILSSLLACSYPLEIIVVDDGSTDPRSVVLIDELADTYKFTLIRQANAGRARARNTGIARARGNFIQLLDADDLLAPGKINIQVDEFRSDPEIDICISEYEFCDTDGLNRRVMEPSTIDRFSLSKEDFLLHWERGLSIPIHCALFRRELLEKTNFRTVTASGHEDWILWVELSSRLLKFKFNPAVLAAYRIHGGNTVSKHEEMGLDFIRACLYITHVGLTKNAESFLHESVHHFRKAYLGSIKHDAILWSRTHNEA